MLRKLRLALFGVILCLAFVAPQTTGAITATTTCSTTQTSMASTIGGSCQDWTIQKDSYGNFVGAVFKASSDTKLKAPITGRLDVACGKLWSTSSATRYIWVTKATYWKFGSHSGFCQAPLTAAMAADKYNAGPPSSWTRIAGSESTGWKYSGLPEFIYVFHGHLDTASGTVSAGNWTSVQVTEATAWYFN